MPPEGRAREAALDWLRHARSNLALARQPKPEEKAILKLWARENGLSVSN